MHNARRLAGTFDHGPGCCCEITGLGANREAPVAVALEINFALWVMIACLAIRASQFIHF
jgi:hypothetical protein